MRAPGLVRRAAVSLPAATVALVVAALPAPADAAPPARGVAIAFLPASAGRSFVDVLAGMPGISGLGLLSPTEIDYNQRQTVLDLTQASRVPHGDYRPAGLPALELGSGGRVTGWSAVVRRARSAPAQIEPGLLAQSVGGAAYAGGSTAGTIDAVVAADRSGRIAALSRGTDTSIVARAQGLLSSHRLVVVDLPPPPLGPGLLRALLRSRQEGVLVVVIQTPPATPADKQLGARLLGIAEAGLPGAGQLRTTTTRLPGLVTSLDIGPTVTRWLGVATPSAFKGEPITAAGPRDVAGLRRLDARLGVISGRRFVTVESFLLGWLAVLLLAGAIADRRGLRAALRIGGLAALWAPTTTLITAALGPSRVVETTIIVGGGFLLATATDRLLRWPRGPILPAAAMLVAYTVDLATGSPLIVRSLLGPDPLLGARFYGIGNELEAALPIVLFGGLAALLPRRTANNRDAMVLATIGLAFTAIVAVGRLGADVGALFTIGGGTAAATVLLLPGGPSRRNVLIACAVPFVGLGLLALLDLATASASHYTRTVLHAHSIGDELDTARRKLTGAWRVLRGGLMPLNSAVALAGAAYVIRHRARTLAPVAGASAWPACLAGGLVGSIAGSLTNDSGPQLLVIGSFGLACLIAYVRGDPRLAG